MMQQEISCIIYWRAQSIVVNYNVVCGFCLISTTTANVPEKHVVGTKPQSDNDAKIADLVVDGLAKNGDDDEGAKQDDDKESSHDRLVTVTPLSNSLSSELSATLSDDSMAVTPTESIDVSDSGVCICVCICV